MKTIINQVGIESHEGFGGDDFLLITRSQDGITLTPRNVEFKCSEDELRQLIDALIAFKGDESNLGG